MRPAAVIEGCTERQGRTRVDSKGGTGWILPRPIAQSCSFSSLSGADGEVWWGLAEDPERLIRTNEGKEFDNGRNPDIPRLTQGHPRPRPDAVRGWHDLHRR